MIIKDKAYYEDFDRRMRYIGERVDYHIQQANSWKDIYRITKDKRGYGWLNKFARHMNYRHVKKGTEIGKKALDECFNEMICLNNYLGRD